MLSYIDSGLQSKVHVRKHRDRSRVLSQHTIYLYQYPKSLIHLHSLLPNMVHHVALTIQGIVNE